MTWLEFLNRLEKIPITSVKVDDIAIELFKDFVNRKRLVSNTLGIPFHLFSNICDDLFPGRKLPETDESVHRFINIVNGIKTLRYSYETESMGIYYYYQQIEPRIRNTDLFAPLLEFYEFGYTYSYENNWVNLAGIYYPVKNLIQNQNAEM